MKEVWKDIIGWEGIFKISNKGRARSVDRIVYFPHIYCSDEISRHITGRILKLISTVRGYSEIRARLHGKNVHIPIHVSVLEAFICPRPEGLETNHKNGIKTDNRVENLEWVTHKENTQHAFDIGLSSNRGIRGRNKLVDDDIYKIRKMLKEKKFTHKEIGEKFGVHCTTIGAIKCKKSWSHIKEEKKWK